MLVIGFTDDGIELSCRNLNMHAGSRFDALLHKSKILFTPVIHPAMRYARLRCKSTVTKLLRACDLRSIGQA